MAIWTPKDDERLWKMVNEQKLKYATIADLLERTSDSIRNRVFTLRKLHGNDWLSEERVAFFDIESNHLKANIGEMMSWALKPMDGEVIYSGWTRQEAIDWDRLDRRLMRELLKELQNVDLLVTYYGTGFDNKFIRTRAMVLGIPGFPKFGQLKHFDLYYAVKGRMALHSNRLASATEALGIEGKTPLPPSVWRRARLGYPDAMDYVREHNIEDVLILEDLYKELLPYVNVQRKSI